MTTRDKNSEVVDLLKYIKELSNLLETSQNILLICHINPDGDAIGSQLALYHYLLSKGKNVSMLSPNNLQEFLKWMDGSEEIKVYIKNRNKGKAIIDKADLMIMVDFNQANRLGEAEKYVKESHAFKIVIDHHLDSFDIANLVISDPSKCSTSELIWELIREIDGKPFMNKPFAEAVYVGIITDTGNFEHGAYTGRTLRIVADIIESGIEKERILNVLYNNFSVDRMRLQGLALNKRLTVLPELNTAYIILTRQDLQEYNHVKGDTEGFVNLPLSIKGVVLSVLLIEKENFVKLSFRSKGSFPTNEFAARYFSGGGHLNASGGEYFDTLENTTRYFLNVLKENIALLKGEV